MWLIFEIFVVYFKLVLYWLEAAFRRIIPPPKKNIEGQTVLITGAGGGIGRLLSLQFAAHGAKLVRYVQGHSSWFRDSVTLTELSSLVKQVCLVE